MATAAAFWRNERIFLALLVVNTLSFFALFDAFSSGSRWSYRRAAAARRPRPEPAAFFDRLLDLNDFRYVIDSGVCSDGGEYTPILVHSRVDHFESREAIRRAYPRAVLDRLGFRYVFLTGLDNGSPGVQGRLLRESARHGDIVQGNFLEAYRNLTYKHVMGLGWFAARCPAARGVVKTDDDIAVNLYKLRDVVRGSPPDGSRPYELAGCVIRAKPIRDARNKWHVTRAEYAGDAYPAFVSGWLYAATAGTVRRLLRAVRSDERYFWIDDLFVTGVLAERARVVLTDLRPHFETDPGPVHCCVHKRQRCEFLAAPTGDDRGLLRRYAERIVNCRVTNSSCDAFQKSKRHHPCLDLWKKSAVNARTGKPSIEILN